MKRKYLLKSDPKDGRDFLYAAHPRILRALPPKVDLTPQCPPVYDQGELGSCTANAIAGAHQFEQIKQLSRSVQGGSSFPPSRLFIYYNERDIEGTTNTDSGACLRDGMKSVAQQGVCPEDECPYIVDQFAVKPTDQCYADALKNQVTSYLSVAQTLDQMKGCLADGYPFVIGITIYPSFESPDVAKTGQVPMPSLWDKIRGALGGHAVMCLGFDDSIQRFIMRNSWGSGWGRAGYFTIPYAYLLYQKLAADVWTIRLVE